MFLTCNFCGDTKDQELFTKNKQIKRGYNLSCKSCTNEKQRLSRIDKNNSSTVKYEKTKKGYLVRTYRNMLSRVTGILKSKSHLYEGLEILDKETFYAWSLEDLDFNRIFDEYVKNEYSRKLSPSIDRVESEYGYTLENMRWLTHSQNSKLGAESQQRSKKSASNKDF